MRNLMIVFVVLVVSCCGVVSGYVHPYGPGDFVHICKEHQSWAGGSGFSGLEAVSNVSSPPYTAENLLFRSDPNDPSGATDGPISKTGSPSTDFTEWYGEKWDFAFIKYYDDGEGNVYPIFVGFADNENIYSNLLTNNPSYPDLDFSGWLQGSIFNSSIFLAGSIPDDVIIVHDSNGDGSAVKDEYGWTLDDPEYTETSDNIAYGTVDVLFGPDQLRGDLSEIVPASYSSTNILPLMVICEYRPYDALYLDGERADFAGLVDLLRMGEYWLTSGNDKTNYHAEGTDWDLNGTVNLLDFAKMAANWNPAEAENH